MLYKGSLTGYWCCVVQEQFNRLSVLYMDSLTGYLYFIGRVYQIAQALLTGYWCCVVHGQFNRLSVLCCVGIV